MSGKFFNATGMKVNRLKVIEHSYQKRYINSKNVVQYWKCLCDCGNTCQVSVHSLRNGTVKSCGCLRTEVIEQERIKRLAKNPNKGLSKTNEWKLRSSAKERAKARGLYFNLKVEDITIPDVCPVLGIPLVKGKGKMHSGSPQLDRKDNSQGYILGNVAVISQRANSIKQDASVETLEALIKYMKGN